MDFAGFVAFVLKQVANLLGIVMEPKAMGIVSVIAYAFKNFGKAE